MLSFFLETKSIVRSLLSLSCFPIYVQGISRITGYFTYFTRLRILHTTIFWQNFDKAKNQQLFYISSLSFLDPVTCLCRFYCAHWILLIDAEYVFLFQISESRSLNFSNSQLLRSPALKCLEVLTFFNFQTLKLLNAVNSQHSNFQPFKLDIAFRFPKLPNAINSQIFKLSKSQLWHRSQISQFPNSQTLRLPNSQTPLALNLQFLTFSKPSITISHQILRKELEKLEDHKAGTLMKAVITNQNNRNCYLASWKEEGRKKRFFFFSHLLTQSRAFRHPIA